MEALVWMQINKITPRVFKDNRNGTSLRQWMNFLGTDAV